MNRKALLLCVSLLGIVVFLAAIAAVAAPREFSPVQKGFTASGESVLPYAPDHVLIKFKSSSMEHSMFNSVSPKRMMAVVGAETGLSSVDAISRDLGASRISRPFLEPKNTVEADRLGMDRWFRVDVRRAPTSKPRSSATRSTPTSKP